MTDLKVFEASGLGAMLVFPPRHSLQGLDSRGGRFCAPRFHLYKLVQRGPRWTEAMLLGFDDTVSHVTFTSIPPYVYVLLPIENENENMKK